MMAPPFHGPCKLWDGFIGTQGYGRATTKEGRNIGAHRFVWEASRGKVLDGMVLDHLCRNRACVNLDHLEVVTPKENTLRGVGPSAMNARKTHCHVGHPLEGWNLIIDCRGNRRCKRCQLTSLYACKARKKAKQKELT